jgi:hypothetical protein
MGDEKESPIVLGRPFLNTTREIIYIRTGDIHFQLRTEKVCCYFNTYTDLEQSKKNKMRRRLQKLQRKLNTKLTDVKNINTTKNLVIYDGRFSSRIILFSS